MIPLRLTYFVHVRLSAGLVRKLESKIILGLPHPVLEVISDVRWIFYEVNGGKIVICFKNSSECIHPHNICHSNQFSAHVTHFPCLSIKISSDTFEIYSLLCESFYLKHSTMQWLNASRMSCVVRISISILHGTRRFQMDLWHLLCAWVHLMWPLSIQNSFTCVTLYNVHVWWRNIDPVEFQLCWIRNINILYGFDLALACLQSNLLARNAFSKCAIYLEALNLLGISLIYMHILVYLLVFCVIYHCCSHMLNVINGIFTIQVPMLISFVWETNGEGVGNILRRKRGTKAIDTPKYRMCLNLIDIYFKQTEFTNALEEHFKRCIFLWIHRIAQLLSFPSICSARSTHICVLYISYTFYSY